MCLPAYEASVITLLARVADGLRILIISLISVVFLNSRYGSRVGLQLEKVLRPWLVAVLGRLDSFWEISRMLGHSLDLRLV